MECTTADINKERTIGFKQEPFQNGLKMLSALGDVSRVVVEVSPLDLPALQEA